MSDSLTVHFTPDPNADTRAPDPHRDSFSKTQFGFWLYLMSDCILFATLFVTFAVLRFSTFGGPTAEELFSLPLVFSETVILLFSSFTCGLAVLAALKERTIAVISWLVITLILGLAFLVIELAEFHHFVSEGHSWSVSAFLSSFFALVGTHGLHITAGIYWGSVLVGQFLTQGMNVDTFRRLVLYSLFWHFLDLIWIFIFTFVYLLGIVGYGQ